MKEFKFRIWGSNKIMDASIIMTRVNEAHENFIVLKYRDQFREIEKKGYHTFVEFCNIRKELEKYNIKLLVKGARRDVHPSGRQLIGTFANQLTIAKRVEDNDEVMIFDNEDQMDLISSVDEQEIFYKNWLDSIKGKDLN